MCVFAFREQKSLALERGPIAAVDSWVKHRKCNDGEHDVVLMRLLFLTPCSRLSGPGPNKKPWQHIMRGVRGLYTWPYFCQSNSACSDRKTHSTLLSDLDSVPRTAPQTLITVAVDQLLSAPRLQSSCLRSFLSENLWISQNKCI